VCQYEPLVDDVTGLIVGAEYNTQATLSGILAMPMAPEKPRALNYVMFVNPFGTNSVKAAQVHSWWYEKITMIDPAQRISDPPHDYISVVTESSQ